MPQRAKGARLYQRKDNGLWIIRENGCTDLSTGTRDRRAAEIALSNHIATRHRPSGPASPEGMKVAEALMIYGREHAPTVADPGRIGNAIAALVPFWEGLNVSAITGETCRRYARWRTKRGPLIDRKTGERGPPVPVSPGTTRRELGCLRAALEHCKREGYLLHVPGMVLPERPPSKERWLSRDEAARLVWTAWRNPASQHLARFILIGLYTGTRKQAILGLQFVPNTSGGWVDLERGVMHRRGSGQRVTKKLQPTIPIPRQLLGHMRRWAKAGGRWVVTDRGARIGDIKTAWNRASEVAGMPEVTPHTLRHTAITWAMQRGARLADAVSFFGVSAPTLESVYWHHHPDHQKSAVEAMERRG
jgi:integrase